MSTNSTKPYLIRSIYDWCIDSGFTPFISVKAYSEMDIPDEYLKDGEIVFNVSQNAVQDLIINNDMVYFMARFNGVSRKLEIPISAVKGIFAKEVNQGMAFSSDLEEDMDQTKAKSKKSDSLSDSGEKISKNIRKSKLRIVK